MTERNIHEGGNLYAKNIWLYEKVCELPDDETVVCTDAFDVIYLARVDEIKQKFLKMNAKIVYSVDHRYAHQLPEFRSFFDEMANNKHFKYLNSGGIIGYAKNIKNMFEVILQYNFDRSNKKLNDQTLVGRYVAENSEMVTLDYDCQIFWTDFDFTYPDSYVFI